LTKRRIISREADANDARGIRLSLTPPGRKLYRKLISAAAERNSAFLGCLSARERACLENAMTKLSREARSFILREKEIR
jgi:DNA-binding MarR family transcriptional regulator